MSNGRKREVATASDTTSDAQGSPSPKRYKEDDNNESKVDEANSSKGKEDKSSKVFNDSVHGHIEIHPLCVKIIDTPQYQRLRNIKQLGGCYHVFPGASHNRFEHGIGTCHLSGMLVKSLKERQEELDITDEDILCVQIAGLCHDLGHGPFSHMFDALFIPTARPESHWKHEVASVRMFDHMMEVNNLLPTFAKYNLGDRDVTFIKELILGAPFEENSAKKWSYTGRGHEKSFLYEIVANKRTGIDVDKFDYFARDCHHLGISNSFDHKRYMKFVRVIDVDVEVEGMRQICVQDKEVHNLYDMFHTRKSLFRRAYQHKTSNIIENMISEALLEADKTIRLRGSHGKMLSISESIDDMEAYSQLSDAIYYEILRSTDPALKEARDILLRIEKRDLYSYIGSTILKERHEKDEIPDIQQEIASTIDEEPLIAPEDFIIDLVTFDYGMGERNPIDEVRFYQKNNPDKPIIYRKEGVSNMLPENFREQEMRIYFRKNDPESLKKAERCFYQWCEGQQCTPPKGRHDSVNFTPLKLKDQTLIKRKGKRLNFDKSAHT